MLSDYKSVFKLLLEQIESRNREISRLNQLLAGGRPVSALAKDCCYRDIGSLTKDVQELQSQKSQIEANCEQAIKSQNYALDEVARLKELNEKLVKELNDIKDIALSVESEANLSLDTLHKRNTALKLKLNESKKLIEELELQMGIHGAAGTRDLKTANIQIKFLQDQVKTITNKGKVFQFDLMTITTILNLFFSYILFLSQFHTECELKTEVEKLIKKNAKLKGKLSADACKCNSSELINKKDAGTMTPIHVDFDSCSIDVNRLKIDRDFYHQEYLKLLNKPLVDSEINLLRKQLIEKNYEIRTLQKELDANRLINEPPMPCRAIEATVRRIEREKKILQDNVQRLTTECDELRESKQLTATMQCDQLKRDEYEMEQLKQRIRQIENENLNLKTMDKTSKPTIILLKDEIAQLKVQVADLIKENVTLHNSNKHLQVLQDQTENALFAHQSRLTNCEYQRNQAETRLNIIDSSRTDGYREISELRSENYQLRTLNTTLSKEKDKLIVSGFRWFSCLNG